MPLALVWPHLVNGAGAAAPRRRGADADLEAAWALAEQLDEPLRRLPVLAALAERMWLTGIADERVTELAGRALRRLPAAPGAALGRR